MAAAPTWTGTPKIGRVQISTANTNLDGTGTLGTLLTGTTNGTRITAIRIIATVTTTAGMVRLFIDDGSNVRLYKEYDVTAITPSATVSAFEIFDALDADGFPFILPNGYILKVSTENAETFNVFAFAGDF